MKIFFVVFFLFFASNKLIAQDQIVNVIETPEVMRKRKNSVFVEVFGNNICYSLNYERRFFIKNKFNFISAKLGLAPIAPLIGSAGSVVNITTTYNILCNGNSYFEVGIGLGKVTIAKNVTSERSYEVSLELLNESYFYFTPVIGYRKQFANGFMVRGFLTMLTTTAGYPFFPSPQLQGPAFYPFTGGSVGFSF